MTADLTRRTDDILRTHPEFLADTSLVILNGGQLDVLKRFQEDVRALGPGLNFIIERCVDENLRGVGGSTRRRLG